MNRTTQLWWSEVKVGLVVVIALTLLVAMIMNLEEGMGLLARQRSSPFFPVKATMALIAPARWPHAT